MPEYNCQSENVHLQGRENVEVKKFTEKLKSDNRLLHIGVLRRCREQNHGGAVDSFVWNRTNATSGSVLSQNF